MNFQVCIIGAGTAGMAAAYALKDTGYKVLLVERQPMPGGTAVNAWVETWIAGLTPPYLKEILRKDFHIDEERISKTSLPASFSRICKDGESSSLYLPRQKMCEIYLRDMNSSSNIQLMCNYQFVDACIQDRRIKSIRIQNIGNSHDIREIVADFFIDASGNGDLAAYKGCLDTDYYVGEDPYERFKESLASQIPLKQEERVICLNEPSLFFRVAESDNNDMMETLSSGVPSKYRISHTSDFLYDGYNNGYWVNPMTGMNLSGWTVINAGEEQAYEMTRKQIKSYWGFIQKEVAKRIEEKKELYGYSKKVLSQYPTRDCAPMLGIRESRRIVCQYMLKQEDLSILASAKSLGQNIALGSHEIDLHVYGHLSVQDVKNFNKEELRPSGIPYACMIPKRFDNVLVACRAYGASHIALSARRVNKDMAQLGWAAGKALVWCLDQKNLIDDVNKVDVFELQSAKYTGFIDELKYIEENLLKEEFKKESYA